MKKSFSTLYPYLAWWCENHGFIQVGKDEYNYSLVTIIDEGGTCWESEKTSDLNEALKAAEKYLKEVEIPERFGEEVIAEIENS